MNLFPSHLELALAPLGWALIHFLWQGALIAAGLAVVLMWLPQHRASLRYGATCAALALFLVTPFLTVASLSGTIPATASQRTAPLSSQPASVGEDVPESYIAAQPLGVSATTKDIGATPSPGLTETGLRFVEPLREPIERNLNLVLALWILGVGSVGTFHLRAWIWTRSLRRREVQAAAPTLRRWVEDAATELGIQRPIQVLISGKVDVPLTFGWLRPVILLPASAVTGLRQEHIEALLWHELAHIRRHDYVINLLQVAVETLFFYHPAVWWVSAQVRQEREHCCDDVAAREVGSRSDYVASLAAIEWLRSPALRLSMRADGGSLLGRVRRLAALEKRSPAGPGWILPTAVVPVLLLIALGISAPGFADPDSDSVSDSEPVSDSASDPDDSGRWQTSASARRDLTTPNGVEHPVDDSEIVDGEWTIRRNGNKYDWIQFETWNRGGRNIMGSKLDDEALSALEDAALGNADEGVLLRREAGTFHLLGRYDPLGRGTLGRGDFSFYPDADYFENLEAAGVRGLRGRHHFPFAAANVTVEKVRAWEAVGYGDLRADRVLEFAIHGVTPEFIADLGELGYKELEEDRLVEFVIHGVSPGYIEAWQKHGMERMRPSELVELKIHGADPDLIEALREAGLDRVPIRTLVEMTIHGVTPRYIAGLADAGFDVDDLDRVVSTKIHGVTPAYLMELQEAGVRVRDLSEIVEMKIHGVDPRFAAALVELGYEDVRPSTLVGLKIHGVNARYVHDLADLGYKDIELDTLREMKIHGVTPGYIERLREKGYDRVSPRRLIEMKIHGVGH